MRHAGSRNGAGMQASERPIESAARAGFQTRMTAVSRRSSNNAAQGTPAQKQVHAALHCLSNDELSGLSGRSEKQ